MEFEFLIAVKIKNDGLTQDATPAELTGILMDRIINNAALDLPWVLSQDIKLITRDTRETSS
jgi:hypothetical protein